MESKFSKRLLVPILSVTPSYFTCFDFVVPDYQRKWMWTRENQEEFLASIFEGISMDAVFINRKGYNEEILDGKHRILTLIQFMGNKFKVNGFKWEDLSGKDKRQFKSGVHVPMGDCSSLKKGDLLLLYYRINYKKVTKVDKKNEDHILKLLRDERD